MRMRALAEALSPHILVVENDPDLHAVIKTALEFDGHHVTFTAKRGAAIGLLSAVKINLVIADVGLPDGLGTEVVSHAAALGVPSIVMTGHPGHMAQLDLKGVAYIAKPFRLERLRREIREKLAIVDAA
jgi:DNA-binding response OmpR family regulator